MKKTFLIFFITFLLTGMNNAQAQCAMCRRVAETAHSHESSKARGLNNGIPPVPLSIPYIGVYHNVERTEAGYRLAHERPGWRFWHNGDQHFRAQPGDRVFVFFRVFSPARFSDQVLLRWYWKDGARGWTLQDTIPIRIVGGREEGFRGYGVKAKYQPGAWKVQVETTDGREIGRIYFSIEEAPPGPRSFRVVID